jgi:hypothetical protein
MRMLMNVRSATLVLGRWLLPALIVPSALACSAPADPVADPERAFVETPGGRRISFDVAKSGAKSGPALSVDGQPFVVAKFDGRVTPAARRALVAAGYREVAYLPYDALLLERPRGATDGAVPGMVGFAPYTAADRLSRELLPDAIAARATQPDVAVMVHVMPGRDRAAVRAAVQARGGRIVGDGEAGSFGRLSVLFPRETAADDARLLAEQSDVFFLERIHRLGLFNDRLVGTMQSGQQGNDVAKTPIWAHGLRGENQIVGEIDTGIDANSCYFNDTALPVTNTWSSTSGYGTLTGSTHRKIVAYDFLYSCDQYPMGAACETSTNLAQWDTQGHGTHVAGNIVGDSDMSPATYAAEDAIAPAAKIVMQDAGYSFDTCAELPGLGCPVINLEPLFEQSFTQGARVHNNSYGDNEEAMPPYLQSNYTARTVDVDHFMWTHKDFLIINAAGNYGQNNTDFSVGSPATMKDGLSIGSARRSSTITSDENISAFSSRGWSSDGRIKPDLMTPGYNSSASNNGNVGGAVNCGTNTGGGTSYASPVAVGTAALVRQYFIEGFYPSGAKNAADQLTPTAALLKATLINSAVSMTGTDNANGPISPIPSNEQGWGRIRLDQSLVFAGDARKLMVDDHRATWTAGATTPVTYTVQSVTAGQQLKATLVWTDYPSVPDSPPVAQPNLGDSATWAAARLVNDLDLKVEGASVTYLGNVFTNGTSSTGGTADRRNNVEQVLIASTVAGDYTITVTPFSIVQDGQDFALVVTWGAPAGQGTDAGTDADSATDSGGQSSDASDAEGASDGNDASDADGTGAGGSGGIDGSGGAAGAGATGGTSGTGGAGGSGDSGTREDSGRDGSADVTTGGAAGVGGAGGIGGTGGSTDGGPAGTAGRNAGGSGGRAGSAGTGGNDMGGRAGTAGSIGTSGSAGSGTDAGDGGRGGSADASKDGSGASGSAGARTDAGTDDTGDSDGCNCALARRKPMPSTQLLGLLGLLAAAARRRARPGLRTQIGF